MINPLAMGHWNTVNDKLVKVFEVLSNGQLFNEIIRLMIQTQYNNTNTKALYCPLLSKVEIHVRFHSADIRYS